MARRRKRGKTLGDEEMKKLCYVLCWILRCHWIKMSPGHRQCKRCGRRQVLVMRYCSYSPYAQPTWEDEE
jgi:hypothetical protein